MRLLVPALIAGIALYLSAMTSVSFFVTILILAGMLVLATWWPWPDVMRTASHQPAQRSRRRVPGCAGCSLTNTPPCAAHRRKAQQPHLWATPGCPRELASLAKLLDDEDSLASASAAEQEARRTTQQRRDTQ